ncbi:MAG TPA: methyltransferase domain-containing protein, partial [Chitinophagaceae bacterium]|nr:methyltransferase domain-containing protein [Chitinophagaceae bacterium]
YRMHGSNMSGNVPLMLDTSLEVLQRQKALLKSDKEKMAMQEGMSGFQNFYTNQLFCDIQTKKEKPSQKALDTLKRYRPDLYRRVRVKQLFYRKKNIRKLIPEPVLQVFHRIGLYKGYQPSTGNVRWGDLKRTIPFSKSFGFDRGGAIDRYYIENFLLAKSNFIKGKTLEIGDNDYTIRFGKTKVTQSDILHVDDTNPKATIIGDLSNSPQIHDESFDCIILTQTLHLVYDYKSVIHTCYRILKPGGALLITVPGITPIDYGEWGENWFWSFTERSVIKILSESFASTDLEVQTFGNVGIASAFLYGVGRPEVTKEFLDFSDPHFPVIITAKAVKKTSG